MTRALTLARQPRTDDTPLLVALCTCGWFSQCRYRRFNPFSRRRVAQYLLYRYEAHRCKPARE